MTATEFLQLPETNLPRQLLNGEVIEMNASELPHQDVVINIVLLWARKEPELGGKVYVAPVDVYFDEANMPQPDVLWLASDTQCQIMGDKHLSGAPDLIAEVLSPSTAHIDRKEKFRLYEKYGVREYWMVEPRYQLVEVWQHHDGRFVLLDAYGSGEVFKSTIPAEINVANIFKR